MTFVGDILLLFVLSCIFILYYKSSNGKNKMPPGEWGWPVVGYRRPAGEPMADTLARLRKKHGNVFTMKVGGRVYVYLCDLSTMKKVLGGPNVTIRPEFFSFKAFTMGKIVGVFNTSGEMWQTTRRFTMKHLKDLGLGKSSLEVAIEEEARLLVQEFKKSTNTPVTVPLSLNVAIMNIMWKMVSDKRYKLDDPFITKFQQLLIDIFTEFQGNVVLFDMYPQLERWMPKCLYGLAGVQGYVEKSDKLADFIKNVVDEHKATIDVENPRDFIDEFIIEMRKDAQKNNEAFSDDNLFGSIADLFANSTETTSSTIRWIILYLAKHQEVQKRLQQEIDSVVPRSSLPNMNYRESLPYTEAVFHEVQRLVSLLPMTLPRTNDTTVQIDQYQIPKGTVFVGHLEGVHYDPQYWEKPTEFYPQHFIDSKGKFTARKECYVPFSIGRRVCPGESMANTNIFLFGSALLQNFTFSPVPGETLSTDRDPNLPQIVVPPTYRVIIKER